VSVLRRGPMREARAFLIPGYSLYRNPAKGNIWYLFSFSCGFCLTSVINLSSYCHLAATCLGESCVTVLQETGGFVIRKSAEATATRNCISVCMVCL